MVDFSNIKVGDKIKYYPRFWGDFPHVATVTKVTPKQFKDSRNVIFRKSDDRCISSSYIYCNCSIATEEDFVKQMRALNEKEIEIARQKYELKKQHLEEYPIKINYKVDCNEKAC